MDINTCVITGNIGSDLELKHTNSGTAVLDFNLAVTEGFGDKKRTNWIGVKAWSKAAESMAQFLGKGRKIVVAGRLSQEEWEDKDTGKKRSKTLVVVDNWTFADSGKGERQESTQPARRTEAPPARRQEQQEELPVGGGEGDDDIPFNSFEKHSPLPL